MSQEESISEVTIRGIRCKLALQSKRDQPLHLYGVVQDDETSVTCFVEAMEGEAFQITVNFDDPIAARRLHIYVGGRFLQTMHAMAGEGNRIIDRAQDSDFGWRALTFCKPTTTDDDKSSSVLKDEDTLAEFGVIRVDVQQLLRVENTRPAGWTSGVDSSKSVPGASILGPPVIYEKIKKAIGSLDARLGDPVETITRPCLYGVPNPSAKPCTFRFVCLSRLGLQLRDFVPHEEVVAERERQRERAKRAREEARLEAEESQLMERVERIKRQRASLNAEASTSASSSSQINVKPDPDRVPFDFNTGGRSNEDPLVVDDSD
ncbi:hypothetical protein CF327_g7157 [Tilletia walkeri]|nr:hypothetical protein CF327_g7157 [Tilletia walkeri]